MRKNLLFSLLIGLLIGCAGNTEKSTDSSSEAATAQQEEQMPKYDKVDGVAVDMTNKGIGPVKSVTLPETIDQNLAKEGEKIYNLYCLACHKVDKKFIGPAPVGVLERRSPEWVMNMIIDPEGMVANDPIARQLLIEYNGSPMANQGIDEEKARAILEYFRTL